jgi:glucose-1-phosphatase
VELPISPQQFLENFRRWLAAPFPGADDLVCSVKKKLPVGCLSNTNQVHRDEAVVGWPLVDLFDFRFLSFQIGLLKPDAEVFDYAARAAGLSPSRILFLDDNLINFEAAREAGFEAIQVRGVDQARTSLDARGLL